MIIEILDLIKQKTNYGIEDTDNWLAEILNNEDDECCVIVPEFEFSSYLKEQKAEKILDKFNLIGMYQLGKIYSNCFNPMLLIHLSKRKQDFVMFGFFSEDTFEQFNESNEFTDKEDLVIPSDYTDLFYQYIEAVEALIYDLEQDFKSPYFKKVSIDDIDKSKLIPEYYKGNAVEIRKFLKTEKMVKLSEIADVIYTKKLDSKEVSKIIGYPNLKYPFIEEDLKEGTITNCIAEKGDIIFPIIKIGKQFAYLFKGSKEKIYVSSNMLVIRAKKVSPEYLYLYLSSDTAQEIYSYMNIGPIYLDKASETVENLPIIMPEFASEKYVSDFNVLTEKDKRNYQIDLSKEIKEYNDKLVGKNAIEPGKIEDILSIEIANKIKVHNEKQLRTFLTDDLNELNVCFREKAYKATLILAGSILEAVLIDWLSEIDHCNYFVEDLFVTDKWGNKKRAGLSDYINEIKYIEQPNWMAEAKKAHEIREKRNLVHAKLCLKSDEINEKVCRQVVSYLEDVLKTRGIFQNKYKK